MATFRRELAGELEESRGEIDELDHVRDPTRRVSPEAKTRGHPNALFVELGVVADVAVLEQRFAVVGGDDEHRVLEKSALVEAATMSSPTEVSRRRRNCRRRAHDASEDFLGWRAAGGRLSSSTTTGNPPSRRGRARGTEARVERSRRIVRKVGLAEMDVGEEAIVAQTLPSQASSSRENRVAVAGVVVTLPHLEELVVASIETEGTRGDRVSREPGGPIAPPPEEGRERRHVVAKACRRT